MTIRVRGLEVEYRQRDRAVLALRGVDLTIQPGEVVAIIGRSGAGKSTLLRVLAGLVSPTRGAVEIAGHQLSPGAHPERAFHRDVGIVFQDHGLVPQLRARDNALCGRLHDYGAAAPALRFDPAHVAEVDRHLARLGLSERITTRASRLSGGERQRVAVARLLFQHPQIALLDEPVASLDIHWADESIRAIEELNDGATTIVAVLHDLALVRRWATRAVWVDEGKIVFDGAPDEACRLLEASGGAGSDGEAARDRSPTSASEEAEPRAEPEIGGWSRRTWYALVVLAALAAYAWALVGVDVELDDLLSSGPNAVDFVQRAFPPDLSAVPTLYESLIETIQMALIGTTTAAIVALPLAIAGASNISPKPVFLLARMIMNIMRTIPSIIWGLFFVILVGLGPFPGILALTFYAAGYLGKFYYEGIESIDPAPGRALRSVGASRLQRFRWAVFPQVFPVLLGHTLYMLEYNVRAASILGIVGAGGIGFYLNAYVNNFLYPKAATAILLLLLIVTVIDAASTRLRHWVMR